MLMGSYLSVILAWHTAGNCVFGATVVIGSKLVLFFFVVRKVEKRCATSALSAVVLRLGRDEGDW